MRFRLETERTGAEVHEGHIPTPDVDASHGRRLRHGPEEGLRPARVLVERDDLDGQIAEGPPETVQREAQARRAVCGGDELSLGVRGRLEATVVHFNFAVNEHITGVLAQARHVRVVPDLQHERLFGRPIDTGHEVDPVPLGAHLIVLLLVEDGVALRLDVGGTDRGVEHHNVGSQHLQGRPRRQGEGGRRRSGGTRRRLGAAVVIKLGIGLALRRVVRGVVVLRRRRAECPAPAPTAVAGSAGAPHDQDEQHEQRRGDRPNQHQEAAAPPSVQLSQHVEPVGPPAAVVRASTHAQFNGLRFVGVVHAPVHAATVVPFLLQVPEEAGVAADFLVIGALRGVVLEVGRGLLHSRRGQRTQGGAAHHDDGRAGTFVRHFFRSG